MCFHSLRTSLSQQQWHIPFYVPRQPTCNTHRTFPHTYNRLCVCHKLKGFSKFQRKISPSLLLESYVFINFAHRDGHASYTIKPIEGKLKGIILLLTPPMGNYVRRGIYVSEGIFLPSRVEATSVASFYNIIRTSSHLEPIKNVCVFKSNKPFLLSLSRSTGI